MAEKQVTKKNTLSTRWAHFQSLSSQDKRRTITDLLFNNAMYIIIVLAIIFIAIRVPQFISLSSIVNVISLTAAKLPIALGIQAVSSSPVPIFPQAVRLAFPPVSPPPC